MASLSPVFLPDEIIAEVLSCLTVKPLLRLRCVCKSWKSLISDPTFVKLHLHRSSQNAYFTLVSATDFIVASFKFDPLFKNTPIVFTFPKDPYYQLDNEFHYVIGSCNGLICLIGYSLVNVDIETMWFRFWNPATRKISDRLGSFYDNYLSIHSHFSFGCDESTNTYKVVTLTITELRIFSLCNNAWTNIPNPFLAHPCTTKAMYLSGSVNWLAIQYQFDHNYKCIDTTIEQFVIISFDFSTKTHSKLLLPPGFDEVPFIYPSLSLLDDCLCFSHDFKHTHFVIWQMKEFRVEDSWTQFLKISYQNLGIDYLFNDLDYFFLPLCLFEKNGILLLTNKYRRGVIVYNWRDNRVQKIGRPWWWLGTKYVESLVSCC